MKRNIKLFISHASEDKKTFVDALVAKLQAEDFEVWYDALDLRVGDSLRSKIDEGLRTSDYGVVVFSPNFFNPSKKWTAAEVDGLFSLETTTRKIILPVWLNVGKTEVDAYSPMLSGRLGANAKDGLANLDSVVAELKSAIYGSERRLSLDQVDPADEAIQRVTRVVGSKELSDQLSMSEEGVRIYEATLKKIEDKLTEKFAGNARFSFRPRGDDADLRLRGPGRMLMDVQGRIGLYANSLKDVFLTFDIFELPPIGSHPSTQPNYRVGGSGVKWKPYFVSQTEMAFKDTAGQQCLGPDELVSSVIKTFCSIVELRCEWPMK